MRSRGTGTGHQEAVTQRLALLSEQLAAAREEVAVERAQESADDVLPAAGGDWWESYTRVSPAPRSLHVVPDDVPGPPEPPAPPGPAEPPASPPTVAAPTTVPTPGRHAGRRIAGPALPGGLATALPATLRGRAWFGPGPVAVVALLVAAGLAVTCWWLVRSDPESTQVGVAEPVVASGSAPADLVTGAEPDAGAEGPADGTEGATGKVTVDVAGKVRRPGIVVLRDGARVVDALEQAGGARRGVDLTPLNLARVLVDGEQIVVGVAGAVAPPAAGAPPAAVPGAPAALVDLNLATQAELEALPEVGPVTALAIIAWREENGAFTAVTELLEVDGIGDATLAQLTPLVTV